MDTIKYPTEYNNYKYTKKLNNNYNYKIDKPILREELKKEEAIKNFIIKNFNESEAQQIETENKEKNNEPIGIGKKIGFGGSKTAYEVKQKTNFFTNWPHTDLSKLCIVIMKPTEENFKDISLHKVFADYGFAPNIYDTKQNGGDIYLLEDRCGTQIDKYIKESVEPHGDKYFFPDDIFKKIIDFIRFIISIRLIQIDAKPENTCSIIENGVIQKIIALDFESFRDYQEEYKIDSDEAFLFMLIQFLYNSSKFSKIFATPQQLEHELKYDDVVKIVNNIFSNYGVDLIDFSMAEIDMSIYGIDLLMDINVGNPNNILIKKKAIDDLCKHIGLNKHEEKYPSLNEIDGGNLKKHKSGKRKSRKCSPQKSKKCSYRRRTKERYKQSKIKKP